MGLNMLHEGKEILFGVFYVMLEGADQDGGAWALRTSLLLLFIDAGQVLRAVIQAQYGWGTEVAGVVEKFDLVRLILSLVYDVIPPWVFYMIAGILVVIAICNTAYVAYLFRRSRVDRMWPVKMLRFLVTALATTFFTNVLDFLLFPVACAATDLGDESFSVLFHGHGAPCTPFSVPEVAITVPSLLLACIYVILSLTATLLAFEINPLSRHPTAMCTGRVEFVWTVFKVAASVLIFLAAKVSAIAAALFLFLFAFGLARMHIKKLPFHDHVSNMVRGGVYAAVCYASLCNFIISCLPDQYRHVDGDSNYSEELQWSLIGCIPLSFIAGAALVHRQRSIVAKRLKQLRREYNAEEMGGNKSRRPSIAGSCCDVRVGQTAGIRAQKRSLWQKFFDKEWEQKVAFRSAAEAHIASRIQLYKRNEHDIQFVLYIVQRGIIENPTSNDLSCMQLLLLRFVCQDAVSAAATEKMQKLNNTQMSLDKTYLLYAVNRCASQEREGENMGRSDGISAINLMEFNLKMEKARNAHRDAVTHMKKYWRIISKVTPGRPLVESSVEDLIGELEAAEISTECAKQEYSWLLSQYPSSQSVLLGYAHFCDTVLNNSKESEKHRSQAQMLETDGVGDAIPMHTTGGQAMLKEMKDTLRDDDYAPSQVSSENETIRSSTQRYMTSWQNAIMGSDFDTIVMTQLRVRIALVVLVLLATVGFVIVDELLFNEVAIKNIHLIDTTGALRFQVITVAYLLRSQFIAANENNTARVQFLQKKIENTTKEILYEHRVNYNEARGYILEFFQTPIGFVDLIQGETWVTSKKAYWEMLNDFSRRSVDASSISADGLRKTDWSPAVLSNQMENTAYIYQNVIRNVLPQVENVVKKYIQQVNDFGKTGELVSIFNVTINAFLLLVIAAYVLKAVNTIVSSMQYKYVVVLLGLSLPKKMTKMQYKFFSNVEMMLASIEEADDNNLMNMESTDILNLPLSSEGALALSVEKEWREPSDNSFDDEDKDTVAIEDKADLSESSKIPLTLDNVEAHSHKYEHLSKQRSLHSISMQGTFDVDTEAAPLIKPQNAVLRALGPILGGKEDDALPTPDPSVNINKCESSSDNSARGNHGPSEEKGGEQDVNAGKPEGEAEQFTEQQSEQQSERQSEQEPGGVLSVFSFLSGRKTSLFSSDSKPSNKNDQAKPKDIKLSSDIDDAEGSDTHVQDPDAQGVEASKPVKLEPPPAFSEIEEIELLEKETPEELTLALQSSEIALERSENGSSDRGVIKGNVSPGNASPSILRNKTSNLLPAAKLRLESEYELNKTRVSFDGQTETAIFHNDQSYDVPRVRIDDEALMIEEDTRSSTLLPGSPRYASKNMLPRRTLSGEQAKAPPLSPLVVKKEALKGEPKKKSEELEPPPEIQEDVVKWIRKALSSKEKWYNKLTVYGVVLGMTLGWCIFSILYPARQIIFLMDMAPLTDATSKRMRFMRECTFYARELMLDDNFSRLTRAEASAALQTCTHELIKIDRGVRIGDPDLGINVGQDVLSKRHNSIMYDPGCPWRKDPTNCTMATRKNVAETGLFGVFGAFVDSLHEILAGYGTAPSEYDFGYAEPVESQAEFRRFDTVELDHTLLDEVRHNKDMLFLEEMFEGDLNQGMRTIEELVLDSTKEIVDNVHGELRVFYAIYVVQIAVVLYYILFQRTVNAAFAQVSHARKFVGYIPSYLFTREEQDIVRRFFDSSQDAQNHDDDPQLHDVKLDGVFQAARQQQQERLSGLHRINSR